MDGEVFGTLLKANSKAPDILVQRYKPVSDRDEIESLTGEMRAVLGQEGFGPIRNLTVLVERAGVCVFQYRNFQDLMACPRG